jgi:hypothetical protein
MATTFPAVALNSDSSESAFLVLRGLNQLAFRYRGYSATCVVHLGQDLGTSGSVAARTMTAAALGDDARRRKVLEGF